MANIQRATIYFQPRVYRALKIKSALSDRPISDLVNEAVVLALREDAEDRRALRKGAKQSSRPFDEFVRELKRDGLL